MQKKKMARLNSEPHVSYASMRKSSMGEEKPEEELMGKRKPSPRLSQHVLCC